MTYNIEDRVIFTKEPALRKWLLYYYPNTYLESVHKFCKEIQFYGKATLIISPNENSSGITEHYYIPPIPNGVGN